MKGVGADNRDIGKEGGPMHPIMDGDLIIYHGLSARDYFAGQALVGLVTGGVGRLGNELSAYAAERAYALADAMLAHRSKQEGK